MSGNPYLYLARHPRLAARKVSERLGRSDRATNLADEADRLQRALSDVNHRLQELGAGSPTGKPFVLLDYERAEIRISARSPKRRNAAAKEPFTVAWLQREIRDGDVVYDIGANIGAYALIAASVGGDGARVIAFEPGAETFGVLCENVALNGLGDRVLPFPIALSAETRLAEFRYRDLAAGSAQHDSTGTAPAGEFDVVQPVLQFALDDLLDRFELPPPTLVKLDVDGAEAMVLDGASSTLRSDRLRSLMVEMRPGDAVPRILEEAGFHRIEAHEARSVEYGLFARQE